MTKESKSIYQQLNKIFKWKKTTEKKKIEAPGSKGIKAEGTVLMVFN
jgi:hypothetical protein